MTDVLNVPQGLMTGDDAARGSLDGEWFYEEGHQATRLGIKVKKKLHEETSDFQKLTVYETAFFGKILTLLLKIQWLSYVICKPYSKPILIWIILK